MKVRALRSFTDEAGQREAGDVFDMSDSVAIVRIKAGLVVREVAEPRKAVRPEPEMAVSRRGK